MDELIKLIEHAKEIVHLLKVRLSKVEAEKISNQKQKEGNDAKTKELADLEVSLKKREAAVKDIEDVAAERKRLEEVARKNEADQTTLTRGKAKFEEDKKAYEEKKANEEALLAKRQKELEAGQKKLDKDRESYRQEVIDEVTKNLGKK